MRSLFWCGAVMTAAMVGGFYLFADYADRNPDSLMGRGVEIAYRIGTNMNPAYRVGQAVAGQAAKTAQIRAFCPVCESSVAGCAVGASQAAETIRVPEDYILGHGVNGDEGVTHLLSGNDECGKADQDTTSTSASVSVEVGAIEECGETKVMPTMPAVGEEKMDLAPNAMPYVDENLKKEITDFWMNVMTFGCFKFESFLMENMPRCSWSRPANDGPATSNSRFVDDLEMRDKSINDGSKSDRPVINPKPDNAEDRPTRPGVDTMEFRPYEDAREGEFDPKPM